MRGKWHAPNKSRTMAHAGRPSADPIGKISMPGPRDRGDHTEHGSDAKRANDRFAKTVKTDSPAVGFDLFLRPLHATERTPNRRIRSSRRANRSEYSFA